MIALSPDQGALLDAALTRSLTRLRARGAELSTTLDELVRATAQAADGGKRFRPALVVATFRAFGGDVDAVPAVWDVAAAFELLHTAFVVHDDVIDRDVERRGTVNVSGRFRQRAHAAGADPDSAAVLGTAAGVLAGDLLLVESMRLLASAPLNSPHREALLALVDEAVLRSAGGELRDVEHATLPGSPDADDLLATAYEKTAVYSFEAPMAAGAVLAGASPAQHGRLRDAAGRLGLAFQLVDDLIGTFGTPTQAGRAAGADLRESKHTTLIALAKSSPDWARVSVALELARTGPIAIRRAQRVLTASGARAALTEMITAMIERARVTAADPVLPGAAVELLADLADRIEKRMP